VFVCSCVRLCVHVCVCVCVCVRVCVCVSDLLSDNFYQPLSVEMLVAAVTERLQECIHLAVHKRLRVSHHLNHTFR
jgi:hypothetical protein